MLVRAELRKIRSTRLWWALLIPVVMIAVLVNAFGGLFTDLVGSTTGGSALPLLLLSLAYGISLTSVFAAVAGSVAAGAEFRHRTVTSTYLTTGRRAPVLGAKMAVLALLGAFYGAVAVLVGTLTGLVSQQSGSPELAAVLQLTLLAVVVCALWGAFGVALGVALGNQVGAVLAVVIYLLAGELVLSTALGTSSSDTLAAVPSYLPGNAGDIALYEVPARALAPGDAAEVVQLLALVSEPPPWWGALLVLAGWTALATAAAVVVGGRRDIT